MKHEYKTFEFKITDIDAEGRTIEGYGAVFGNIDQGDDIIHKGAFRKTLAERGNKIKFLWQHDPGEPIGRIAEISEDDQGLYIKAMISDTARGRDALALLRDGAIEGMSIGYDPVKGGTDYSEVNGRNVRNLREIKLWEISLVTFPMNEEAGVTALKGASGATDLPLASRERDWDSDAAVNRVRSVTNSEDEPSDDYRRAFFWFDGDNSDQFGAYKLPFADVVDGELVAVPRGIFAVAAALQGARAPIDIPEDDMDAVRSRIAGYYGRMREEFEDDSIVAPWDKAMGESEDDKAQKIGRAINARNEARLMRAIENAHAAIAAIEEILDAAGLTDGDSEEQDAPADAGRDNEEMATDKAGPQNAPTSSDDVARQRILTRLKLMEVE